MAGIFRFLAEVEFPGYSPLYEHLANRIADEPWIPAFISEHNRSSFAPVLFFACVRDVTLAHPDLPLARPLRRDRRRRRPARPRPVAAVPRRSWLRAGDEVAAPLETRSIQTNEVGRSAALLPGLHRGGRAVRPPAGADRDRLQRRAEPVLRPLPHRLRRGRDRRGPGRLAGPAHLRRPRRPARHRSRSTAPAVSSSRLGLDLNPIDVTDPVATRWLEACVWPDVPHRLERLRAAVDLARLDPPELRAGNAVDLVADAVRAVPDDAVACLDSTWVLAYFSDDERPSCTASSTSSAPTGAIAYVTAEYAENGAPWVPAPSRPSTVVEHKMPTLLGLGLWDHGRTDHRALAWMPPHGQWIDWLDPTTAG